MQGRIPNRCARRRSGRPCVRYIVRSQRGGALIEIMMSALLVALAATAVFKGIDGATATSGQSKSRAVAVTLAQEDQERMRSMDPRKLSSYTPAPAKKIVNDVEYTVTSTASYVSDRGDSESCTKGDGRVTYVKINSKVEWSDMRSSKPVQSSSIVAINNAYAKGSLAIKIVDRSGTTGVPDIPVTVDPPVSLTKNTNENGCVVFDGLDAGQYFGEFSKAGYVDPGGKQLVRPVNGWNVTTGSTSVATYQYDKAGQANFTFDTKYLTNSAWDLTSAPSGTAVTLVHQNLPSPGTRSEDVAPGSSAYNFLALFPFTTPYAAFAGECTSAAPSWTTPSSLSVGPAGIGTPNPLKLRMPAIGIKVTRNGATPTSTTSGDVRISGANGCIAWRTLGPAGTTWSSANSYTVAPTSSSFKDYAFPPGDFLVCVDDKTGTTATGANKRTVTVSNNTESGQLTTIDIQTGSTTNGNADGHCQ
jgi:Tfp pilus assembly protein PilV